MKIGVGAGFSGDRLDAAEKLLEKVNLDYIVFECLAERTIALAQYEKLKDKESGYDPLLEKRMKRILPLLIEKNVRLITNMGAANPIAAGEKVIEVAEKLGISCKIAIVTGDNVLNKVDLNNVALESGIPLRSYGEIISANAYLGIEALLPALKSEANIIITGRVADPSLFLAPQVYHFDWSLDDYQLLGQGTAVGHLLECGTQVSGGYFGDTRKKHVENLANVGLPYADINKEGLATIRKGRETGGLISLRTVKEQLLYEVHDPSKYITPDVVADFTNITLLNLEDNVVSVTGGGGSPRPDRLKVSVGYHAGYVGEGEISYAGSDALDRAKLAKDIIEKRLQGMFDDFRLDLIGYSATHRKVFQKNSPYEVRLRVVGRHDSREIAEFIGEEVEALYLNGPAAGGGVRKGVHASIGIVSTTISRELIEPKVEILESR